jgi:hypothetical protein
MSVSTKEIDQALLDVRKAYRLLHDYQRAALDAAKYIGAQIGFTYFGGYSNFSNCAPRDGKGLLDNWSWDWLNLVFYDFHFTQKNGEKDILKFSIWLFSDTGYFVSDDTATAQTDVATFASAENSGTKVGFLLYREWTAEFDQFRYDKDAVRRFIENDGELPSKLKDAGIIGKCCDFSRLTDEVSTDTVIAELVHLAQSNGFPLERMNKAV